MNNIIFSELNENISFFECIIVIRNIIITSLSSIFPEVDFREDFELLNGCFYINELKEETRIIKHKNKKSDEEFDSLYYLYNITKVKGIYIIIPFKTIHCDKIPTFFIAILLNKELSKKQDKEDKKILDNRFLIKYKIENKKEEELYNEENNFIIYKIKKNIIDFNTKIYNDNKKDKILNFIKNYTRNLNEKINNIKNENIKEHFLSLKDNYDYFFYEIDDDFKDYNFGERLKDSFKIGLKKLVKDSKIIDVKYDEYELLYYFIPIVVSLYTSLGVEIESFNMMIDEISEIINSSLKFGDTIKFLELNEALIHNIIIDSIDFEILENKDDNNDKIEEILMNN